MFLGRCSKATAASLAAAAGKAKAKNVNPAANETWVLQLAHSPEKSHPKTRSRRTTPKRLTPTRLTPALILSSRRLHLGRHRFQLHTSHVLRRKSNVWALG